MTKDEIKSAQSFLGSITKAIDEIAKAQNQIARQCKGPMKQDLLFLRDTLADLSNAILSQSITLEVGGAWGSAPKLSIADKPGDVTLKNEAFVPKINLN